MGWWLFPRRRRGQALFPPKADKRFSLFDFLKCLFSRYFLPEGPPACKAGALFDHCKSASAPCFRLRRMASVFRFPFSVFLLLVVRCSFLPAAGGRVQAFLVEPLSIQ